MILSDKLSNCAYAQAGLRLCRSQTSEDRFSRVEAHMMPKSVRGVCAHKQVSELNTPLSWGFFEKIKFNSVKIFSKSVKE